MSATNLKYKDANNLPEPRQTKQGKAKKSAKVVPLFRTKSRRRELSALERENLIIDYQIKARKMAFSILRRWHARLDLQEVHSVVDLSLCEAVRRFNPNKGASFLTFLFYHLRGNLIRAVSTAAKLNAVPLAELDLTAHNADEGETTSRSEGRSVSAIEVAQALSGRESPLPDEVLMKKELVRASLEACAKLDKLEREVLFRIYLNEEQLLDVASDLGYSRCHISRVKRRALETLFADVSHLMGEGAAQRPDFDDDTDSGQRKTIHRRKPRSAQHTRCKAAARLINQGIDRAAIAMSAFGN